jgi:DNA polymerase III subunit epsilon
MSQHYISVDVETANRDRSSICQIGLVAWTDHCVAWEWSTLVNPGVDFERRNVEFHGIGSQHVQSAPTWPKVLDMIGGSLRDQILVSHTNFDTDALHHATHRYGNDFPACSWLDNYAIARSAWPNLPRHDLKTLCEYFGIELQHHDALSDARACGALFGRAMVDSGMGVSEWIVRVGLVSPSPYSGRSGQNATRYSEKTEAAGDADGPLFGHTCVFTGDFSEGKVTLSRLAATMGCHVRDTFTKKATMLVVGRRDPSEFNGSAKSRKQIEAEAAIAEGRQVTIMSERQFVELMQHYQSRTTST